MAKSDLLEPIITYDMTANEARAYKISLLWAGLSRKEFPTHKFGKVSPNGDPRKSLLFKYCYKLAILTKGVIPDAELKLYVTAQLQILKRCGIEENIDTLISPACLVGDKAWRRWKLWKKEYDAAMAEASRAAPDQSNAVRTDRVLDGLDSTRRFLLTQFDGRLPSSEEIEFEAVGHRLREWVVRGKVSPYYVLLEPSLAQTDHERAFSFDPELYRPSITQGVREHFVKTFSRA